MNSLLEYLVERSVRNGALSAPMGDRTGSSGPALPATEGLLLSGPGTVRPRSRYERRVGLDSSDAATFLNEEDELRFPRSAPSDRDTSAGPPEQERHLADREAPQEETPRALGGTALPRESTQPVVEPRARGAARTAAPPRDDVDVAPAQRPAMHHREAAPVAERPATPVHDRTAPPPPSRLPAPVEPTEIRARREWSSIATAASHEPPTGRAAGPDAGQSVVRPRVQATTQIDERATISAASPLREPPRSEARSPLRAAAGASQAPRVQVSIGRVEVRAIFTPPPDTATPRSQPGPPMSLDDYLKRRDGSS
jgi:hypothetical protein